MRGVRIFSVLAALAAVPAGAGETRITPDMVSAALEGQGYTVVSSTRTFLGRLRVVASKGFTWREVVLDISTGQILRDYAVEFSPSNPPQTDGQTMPRGGVVLADPDLPGTGG